MVICNMVKRKNSPYLSYGRFFYVMAIASFLVIFLYAQMTNTFRSWKYVSRIFPQQSNISLTSQMPIVTVIIRINRTIAMGRPTINPTTFLKMGILKMQPARAANGLRTEKNRFLQNLASNKCQNHLRQMNNFVFYNSMP